MSMIQTLYGGGAAEAQAAALEAQTPQAAAPQVEAPQAAPEAEAPAAAPVAAAPAAAAPQAAAGGEAEANDWSAVLVGQTVLKRGSKGKAVATMQEKLTQAGQGVSATGEFGATTEQKVVAFQAQWGIQQTAQMGRQTANALEEVAEWQQVIDGKLALREGASRPAVSFLQRALKALGRDVIHSGTFDPGTKQAVQALQRDRGLGVDGVVGKNSANAIMNALRGDAGGGAGGGAAYTGGANWLAGGANFKITHYTYAREDDPKHANSRRVTAPGLNPSETYRESFLGSPFGIRMQGTGLAENGKYIMYVGNGRYAYGVGGKYANVNKPYQQIAVDPTVIRPRSQVVVDPYRDKGLMSADDIGGAIKGNHIDVFVGPVTIQVAYALGTKSGRVGYPTEAAASQPAQQGAQEGPLLSMSAGPTPWLNRTDEPIQTPSSDGAEPEASQPAQQAAAPEAAAPGATAPQTQAGAAPAAPEAAQADAPQQGAQADAAQPQFSEAAPTANWQKVINGETALRRGMKGEVVEELQRRLLAAGQQVGVDGDFGPGTENAVRAVQSAAGQTPDGVVGKNTATALSQVTGWQDVLSGRVTLQKGMKNPAVNQLQQLLTRAGHGVQVTGEFGETTEQKVKEFQEANSIQVTLRVGKTTAEALQSQSNKGSDGFIWPLRGGIYFTSPWGPRNIPNGSSYHQGIDIVNGRNGQVIAAAAGRVVGAGNAGALGNFVDLQHSIGGRTFFTRYGHLASINVRLNQNVNQGDTIGIEGATGGNYAIHLHFEIHENTLRNRVDPLKHLAVPGDVIINFGNSTARLNKYGNFRRNQDPRINTHSY
jgi:peptidoglycan hydrolase-like protein with peptidoglycan-binding domain/3D (Asp-Asp-Asp) domain-containing protein